MTAPTLAVPTPTAGRAGLPIYFLGAFAITWLCWGPVALAARQGVPLPVPEEALMLLGGLGPLLAALGVTAHESGGAGVRALLGQLLRWRAHPGWYAVALLGSVALTGVIVLLTDRRTLTRRRTEA